MKNLIALLPALTGLVGVVVGQFMSHYFQRNSEKAKERTDLQKQYEKIYQEAYASNLGRIFMFLEAVSSYPDDTDEKFSMFNISEKIIFNEIIKEKIDIISKYNPDLLIDYQRIYYIDFEYKDEEGEDIDDLIESKNLEYIYRRLNFLERMFSDIYTKAISNFFSDSFRNEIQKWRCFILFLLTAIQASENGIEMDGYSILELCQILKTGKADTKINFQEKILAYKKCRSKKDYKQLFESYVNSFFVEEEIRAELRDVINQQSFAGGY
ncbi:hypothetical protein [Paenibacillus sp. IHB B 3415]|uniref:hypothetical protein n=1 Tax=Paenibacillus sp. IHB B 3415 TaxID=867080 RepID=UPI00128BC92D|nr:hypothetical protein [Paenibacillus sp. IHB B 3415]